MKTTLIIATMTVVAFAAGMVVSCSPSTHVAPKPVSPINQGSYLLDSGNK